MQRFRQTEDENQTADSSARDGGKSNNDRSSWCKCDTAASTNSVVVVVFRYAAPTFLSGKQKVQENKTKFCLVDMVENKQTYLE